MKRTFAWFRPLRRIALATAGVVVLGISIIGTARTAAQQEENGVDNNRKSMYAAMTEAPEKARERKNPLQGDTHAVAAGGKLFEQHCSDCHGRKAGGTRKGPSLLREEVQQATPGALFWVLTNGVVRRGMPVWSKLPEPERWQIVTFLQSLKLQSQSMNAEPRAPVQQIP
jgi:cytochrome c oxidase cbb3-type subunit 2